MVMGDRLLKTALIAFISLIGFEAGEVKAQEVVGEDTVTTSRIPNGLIDDMLATNESLHLPVSVVRFAVDDDELDNKALRQLNLMVSQMELAEGGVEFYIIASAEASSNLSRFDGVKYGFRSESAEGLRDIYLKTRTEGFGSEVNRYYSRQSSPGS